MDIRTINPEDYYYDLPEDRIAQYPVNEREMSNLLVYKGNTLYKDIFSNIIDYLPSGSMLVFNNSSVIRARILFQKGTGAAIEIMCLEPVSPSGYESSFDSREPVEWKCLIGNLKKWKHGEIVKSFIITERRFELRAEKVLPEGDAWRVRFSWNCHDLSFVEVIEAAGHIPLPPYIKREDTEEDITRYQTVYSSVKGSVAAPTAGLHFSKNILEKLYEKGIKSVEATLHVGAGTFQPIKTKSVLDHEMHCEHFFVTRKAIETILENQGKIIPVGTTSVRILESIFWLGVKVLHNKADCLTNLSLRQWEPYELNGNISVQDSMEALLNLMKEHGSGTLHASTGIMIIPGYNFRLINGMITNFHQPGSTLLLLISAWLGNDWKKIYEFALANSFRFLSYGDCSLLLR